MNGMLSKYRWCAAVVMLTFGHTAVAAPPVGTYCDTPSRCANPMTLGGMVTSSNHLATQAGLKVLQRGGNAVDAAIAVASTISVVYPQMNTIGGDNFWLIYNAKTKTLRALNASGRSGEHATLQFYKDKGLSAIPPRGYLSVNTVRTHVQALLAKLHVHSTLEAVAVALDAGVRLPVPTTLCQPRAPQDARRAARPSPQASYPVSS